MSHRLLLILSLIAVVALAGCRTRGGNSGRVTDDEHQTSGKMMQRELDLANDRILELQQLLDECRAQQGQQTVGSMIDGDLPEGTERTASGGVALPDDFAFAKGSADLNDDGRKAVERLAQLLNEGKNAGKRVVVKGFTDDTPVSRATTKEKFGDNWGLSAARAASVVRALEKAGVGSDRLNGSFRGQLDPREKGTDEAAKARNRRVELHLGN